MKITNKLNALSPFEVMLAFFRYVLMFMSTPAMVPYAMVPFNKTKAQKGRILYY